jgi:hypothetical protein
MRGGRHGIRDCPVPFSMALKADCGEGPGKIELPMPAGPQQPPGSVSLAVGIS